MTSALIDWASLPSLRDINCTKYKRLFVLGISSITVFEYLRKKLIITDTLCTTKCSLCRNVLKFPFKYTVRRPLLRGTSIDWNGNVIIARSKTWKSSLCASRRRRRGFRLSKAKLSDDESTRTKCWTRGRHDRQEQSIHDRKQWSHERTGKVNADCARPHDDLVPRD